MDAVQARPYVSGVDVSGAQGSVDWAALVRRGDDFAYVEATQGTTQQNPHFRQQYNGASDARLIRGSYHVALPDTSTAAAQVRFFFNHGGHWSGDGQTLPPMVRLTRNPDGPNCYGRSNSAMVQWISNFSDSVRQKAGRYPVIATAAQWRKECTGNSTGFTEKNPLFIIRHNTTPGGAAGRVAAPHVLAVQRQWHAGQRQQVQR
ncbi:GH25 family lysozyme [Streptomyces flavidovirens]|uniref:GH25 family lysozyme n=1 Tax=Streptomyces flavidovirens TaxID=67298 RepID=UPI00341C537E